MVESALLGPQALADAVSKRAAPAALVIDAFDRVVMANEGALAALRRLGAEPDGEKLPAILLEALGEATDAALESSSAALTADLCVRLCWLRSNLGSYRLLLFERPRRRGLIPEDFARYGMTPREREAALLVLQGMSNRAIAERLFISEYTVEGYLKQIFTKLGVRSRAALVAKLLGWSSESGA